MEEVASNAGQVSGQAAVRTISSQDLFCNSNELQIRHGDSVYRLRVTKQGKLILNK